METNKKREDVQIFMLCYNKKNYDFTDDSVITPLQCGAQDRGDVCELKDDTLDNISGQNFFFAEMTGIYWIWKNIKNAKYKGNIQYRRRLKGIDENTDFDSIFSKYDVICAKPYNYPENRTSYIPATTVEDGYAYSHCKEDFDVLESIVKESFGEKYAESWDRCIKNGEDLYYSNGFVLPAEKYDEYCNFAFYTIYKWMRRTGVTSYGELVFHVSRNIGAGKYKRFEIEKREPLDCTFSEVEWQCKIGGFFSERLFTLWLDVNIPKERRYEVEYDKMENTYI